LASRPVAAEVDPAVWESVVTPRYAAIFGQLILREIGRGTREQVLDIACGTGHPSLELLKRLGEGARIVAIDRSSKLLDVAQRRALRDSGRRIFFKVASAESLRFGEDVFDAVFGNLALQSTESPSRALSECKRVLVRGGRLLLTQPLSGTFEEVLDMLREAALKLDQPDVASRVETVAANYPQPDELVALARRAGFVDVSVKVDSFRLPFRGANVILTDPLLTAVAMHEWRWIAGDGANGERVLDHVRGALDTYFGGGPLSLSVEAGLLMARKPD